MQLCCYYAIIEGDDRGKGDREKAGVRKKKGVGERRERVGERREEVGERRKRMGRKEIKDKGENEETTKTRFFY